MRAQLKVSVPSSSTDEKRGCHLLFRPQNQHLHFSHVQSQNTNETICDTYLKANQKQPPTSPHPPPNPILPAPSPTSAALSVLPWKTRSGPHHRIRFPSTPVRSTLGSCCSSLGAGLPTACSLVFPILKRPALE